MLRTSHLFRYLIYTLNNKKKHDGKTSFFVRGRGGGGGWPSWSSKWPPFVNMFYNNYSCGCRVKFILAATSRFSMPHVF